MKKPTNFKRLVTNLPFNPSLLHQVSFYAKRLRQESSIRRLGFVFIALTFLVQLFAVIAPPQPSLAQDLNNDLVPGGFGGNQESAVLHCMNNKEDFGSILSAYGISCTNVANAHWTTVNSNDYNRQLYSMGRLPYGIAGETAVNLNGRTYYMRYLWGWDKYASSSYKALVGTTSTGMTFMLLDACGNLVTIGRPTPPPPPAVKSVSCYALYMTVPAGAQIKKNSVVGVKGIFTGSNLTSSDFVDFTYDYIDTTTGKPVVPPTVVKGVHFVNGNATDPTTHNFTFANPGQYQIRMAGLFNGGAIIPGSLGGACAHNVSVEKPPIDVCPDIPGLQTDQNQCKPCEKANNNDATTCLILYKTASNDTQNIANADGTTAKAGDTITYTLSAKNTGKVTVKKFVISENISDILDYADVTDYHGGKINDANVVSWPGADIKAGETLSVKLTVKVKNPIPNTPVSASNPGKFDLTMTNKYGDTTVNIHLPASPIKTTEQVATTLPNTGPGTNMIIGFVVFTIAGYFFYRSRLQAQELAIVSHEFSGGA